MTSQAIVGSPVDMPLSRRFREGSQEAHTAAETSPFVGALLSGEVGPSGYLEYLGSLRTVYSELEQVGRGLAADPVAGPVVDPRLDRAGCLDRDIAYWRARTGGPDPVPTSAAVYYAACIREAAGRWPGLFVAHHYARYLGDLSGGRIIARRLATIYDDAAEGPDGGLSFYDFPGIGKPKLYKDSYRATLDSLPVTTGQAEAMLAEVVRVFDLNRGLFTALATAA
jgi:heme oxygenase (biliverdin-producing, ferredoxin)